MADTFSQLTIQIIFSVRYRQKLIEAEWETELHKYISTIIENKGQKLLTINGTKDHIHILIGMNPSCRISDLVREIKKSSVRFVREQGFCNTEFRWQKGYGVFSYSFSARHPVIQYIMNQKKHHARSTYEQEYRQFLDQYQIDYKDEYLFD